MSFVVAVLGEAVRSAVLHGDTRVSCERAGSHDPPLGGCQKVAIIRPHIAVGFAGDVGQADAVLRELRGVAGDTPERLVDVLRRGSASGRTEFLAVVLGQTARLWTIRDGASNQRDICWLGDPQAFRMFQGYMLGEIPPPVAFPALLASLWKGKPGSERAGEAFRWVVGSGRLSTIGDFTVSICSEPGPAGRLVFRYLARGDFAHGAPVSGAGEQSLMVGDASTGTYVSVSMGGCFPDRPEMGRIFALFFKPAGFGYVFLSADGGVPRPVRVDAPHSASFVARVTAEHGVHLQPRIL